MPLYDYYCKKCDKIHEILTKNVKFIDCPDCNTPMEKQISTSVTARFKGSGFYSTDYGKPRIKIQ